VQKNLQRGSAHCHILAGLHERQLRILLCLVLTSTPGCRPTSPADGQQTLIRAAYTSAADIGDLPSLIAHRQLENDGYRIEETFYAQPELAVEALASGGADVASGGTTAFWAAVVKGAQLRMVMEHSKNGYELAAASGITRCHDLHERTLALSSPGSLPTALGRAFLKRCPDSRPRIIIVPHSGDRLQALINGAVAGAVLQRSDTARLNARAPERFTTIDEFAMMFPNLNFAGVFVTRTFAEAHRTVVVDYVRERIRANRLVLETPAMLIEEAGRWPSVAALDQTIVDGEVRAPAWTRDGGMTRESVAATLKFFAATNSLPESLGADQVADFSFVEAAIQALSLEVEKR
jgi:ABC-type nitrate/sulfonate/bicarbonate transport system substrate-binding protein